MGRLVPLLVILHLLAATQAKAEIIIAGYSDATNDRFSNSTSFLLNGFDLSGVGQAANGLWATAISPQVVVTAAHFLPRAGGPFYFYPGNDPTVAPVERRIYRGMKLQSAAGTSDLYLGWLSEPLPESIGHFNFATEQLLADAMGDPQPVEDAGSFQGLNAYNFGRSPYDVDNDPNRSRRNWQAVGRNRITGYSENVPFMGNEDNDAILFEQDAEGTANFVPYETLLAGGDSGAPMFVDVGGELLLLGTNAFIYEDGAFATGGIGSGINYIGNGEEFVNAFITGVPEPSSAACALWGCFLVAARRRQR